MICRLCRQEMSEGEIHAHIPDFHMEVSGGKYRLCMARYIGTSLLVEDLPFIIPKEWADWVLETCGGSYTSDAMYRLPGMIIDWCLCLLRGDSDGVRILTLAIDDYLMRIRKKSRKC